MARTNWTRHDKSQAERTRIPSYRVLSRVPARHTTVWVRVHGTYQYVAGISNDATLSRPHGQSCSIAFTPTVHAQCRPPGRSCGARPLAPSSMHGKQCHTSNSASQLGILPSSGVVGTPRTRACKLCPTIIPVTLPRCIQSCMQAPAPITSALLLPKFARDALGSAFGEQGSRCDGSFRVVAFLMIA
jgi:hypothetical protein